MPLKFSVISSKNTFHLNIKYQFSISFLEGVGGKKKEKIEW